MLRDYQKKAIQEFENAQEKNICLTMATGSGKTFTFCEIAKRFYLMELKKVLILVHREELLNQAYESLGEKCFKIEKGIKSIDFNFDFYVGMVETVNRRFNNMPDFGLVIIDECHIGNFKKMPYFTNKGTKVLGVTATPLGSAPLSNQYDKLLIPVQIPDLIRNNFLVDCNVYGFASDLVEAQNFKVKKGEFDEKQMEDFYSSEKMVLNVLNAYWEKTAGKKTIIFNVNINHNDTVYNALKEEGLNAYKIDGSTPKNLRVEIINKFNNENDAIICNVGVLTTGFDCPSILTVILNRATKSLPLYLQMVGRGARTYKDKEKFTVIDLGKNTTRFGFYDKYRDWQGYFEQGTKKDSKGGASPTKECPDCGKIHHTRILECDNCGYSFEEAKELKSKQEKAQKLELLIKENPLEIPTQKLINIAVERGNNMYRVLYLIAEHIVKYEDRYKEIVTQEYLESVKMLNLNVWCKHYGKRKDSFNIKFLNDAIEKARK
jgi:superfamily II DNA or RNA helicase